MEYRQGRLIDHVHLRVSDLARSRTFYRAVFEVLGLLLRRRVEMTERHENRVGWKRLHDMHAARRALNAPPATERGGDA